jgi:hypothetical protein
LDKLDALLPQSATRRIFREAVVVILHDQAEKVKARNKDRRARASERKQQAKQKRLDETKKAEAAAQVVKLRKENEAVVAKLKAAEAENIRLRSVHRVRRAPGLSTDHRGAEAEALYFQPRRRKGDRGSEGSALKGGDEAPASDESDGSTTDDALSPDLLAMSAQPDRQGCVADRTSLPPSRCGTPAEMRSTAVPEKRAAPTDDEDRNPDPDPPAPPPPPPPPLGEGAFALDALEPMAFNRDGRTDSAFALPEPALAPAGQRDHRPAACAQDRAARSRLRETRKPKRADDGRSDDGRSDSEGSDDETLAIFRAPVRRTSYTRAPSPSELARAEAAEAEKIRRATAASAAAHREAAQRRPARRAPNRPERRTRAEPAEKPRSPGSRIRFPAAKERLPDAAAALRRSQPVHVRCRERASETASTSGGTRVASAGGGARGLLARAVRAARRSKRVRSSARALTHSTMIPACDEATAPLDERVVRAAIERATFALDRRPAGGACELRPPAARVSKDSRTAFAFDALRASRNAAARRRRRPAATYPDEPAPSWLDAPSHERTALGSAPRAFQTLGGNTEARTADRAAAWEGTACTAPCTAKASPVYEPASFLLDARANASRGCPPRGGGPSGGARRASAVPACSALDLVPSANARDYLRYNGMDAEVNRSDLYRAARELCARRKREFFR